MKELSLHMLDIAQNSIAAGAGHMDLAVEETGGRIILTAADDGRGMPPELLATVADHSPPPAPPERWGWACPFCVWRPR